MQNAYQQPSFKFETNIASYNVQYQDSSVGEEKWVVDVKYNSSENVFGRFELPITWSRELVFGWLSRLEINEIGRLS